MDKKETPKKERKKIDKQKNKKLKKIQINEELKTFDTFEVVVLLVIVGIVSIVATSAVTYRIFKIGNSSDYTKVDDGIQTFAETYQYIIDNYYGEINEEELIDSAVEGMLSSIEDPYTTIIDESSSNTFNITLEGEYEGLGIEIYNDSNNNIIINRIIENSPASESGLQAGDIVISVNDNNLENKSTTEFVNIVAQSKDNKFIVKVKRDNKELTYTLTREKIELNSVSNHTFEINGKKIGYINVSVFANNTYKQFKSNLESLENSGIDSLIIDLRDNTGGHLTAVENMLELFVDSNYIIYQTEDKDGVEKIYSEGDSTKKYPIVILTNRISASASEVMTAALKENLNATIIGETTYGKGTVQELRELSSGQQYKFTTKKWLTPKGNWINDVGIQPDIEVSLDEKYYNNPTVSNDNQLQKALEFLKNK